MTERAVITLPWPSSKVGQNARHGHWASKAKPTKMARARAGMEAMAALSQVRQSNPRAFRGPMDEVIIVADFHPPALNRKRDVQNTIDAAKAYMDGISDALGIDDSKFAIFWPPRFSEPRGEGEIILTLTAGRYTHGSHQQAENCPVCGR